MGRLPHVHDGIGRLPGHHHAGNGRYEDMDGRAVAAKRGHDGQPHRAHRRRRGRAYSRHRLLLDEVCGIPRISHHNVGCLAQVRRSHQDLCGGPHQGTHPWRRAAVQSILQAVLGRLQRRGSRLCRGREERLWREQRSATGEEHCGHRARHRRHVSEKPGRRARQGQAEGDEERRAFSSLHTRAKRQCGCRGRGVRLR